MGKKKVWRTGASLPSGWRLLAGLVLTLACQVVHAATDIQVEQPVGTTLVDGVSSLSFGTTSLGTPVARAFRVSNTGDAPLQVTALALPSAYEHVGPFVPYTLAAGASQSFSVRFLAHTVPGSFPGTLVLTSNDPDAEGTFDLALSATAILGTYPMLDPSLDPDGPGGPLPGGRLLTPMNSGFGQCMALQADGKVLLGGNSFGSQPPVSAIARYNADGTLDTTFGSGGKVFNSSGNGVEHILVQGDGKIVTTCIGIGSGMSTHLIVRYLPNGQLDTSFGSGGNVVVNNGAAWGMGTKTVLQPDGRLVSVGTRPGPGGSQEIVVVRLTSAGALDPAFGSGGMVFLDIGAGDDNAFDLALLADGKIVLAGHLQNGVGRDWLLMRLTSTGAVDASFGSSGLVITNLGGDDYCLALGIREDGKIISLGGSSVGGAAFNLCRYHSNGALDTSFGSAGFASTSFAEGAAYPSALALQRDGKIVVVGEVAGSGPAKFGVARYHTDGTLDSTFGSGGTYASSTGGTLAGAADVAVQEDGKLLVGGYSYDGSIGSFMLARLIPEGRPAVATGSAVVAAGAVTVGGTVGPRGVTTSAWFEYGTTTSYGSSTATQAAGYGTSLTPVMAQLSGLARATLYHYRLVAQSGEGTTYGVDATFTTANDPVPEIVVEGPAGTALAADGAAVPFSTEEFGTGGTPRTFTIRNTGDAPLENVVVSILGADEMDFSRYPGTPTAAGTVAAGGSTTFTLFFRPVSGSPIPSRVRTATLRITSTDEDESPFDVTLTGAGISPTGDVDGDGLNDLAEHLYAALGFDWQLSQPALVATLHGGAPAAGLHTQAQYDASRQAGRDEILGNPNPYGLFTPAQVQALHAPAPLIQRDAVTGMVTMTLGLERSTTLQPGSFQGLPMSLPQISVNGEGRVQFQFNTGDNAAFFRLSAQ